MKRAAAEAEGGAAKLPKRDEAAEEPSGPASVQEKSDQADQGGVAYVGWLDTEIVGHRFHCSAGGKYRYRKHNHRYYCCEEALEAAELCADGDTLHLRRNPRNPYDSNAVQVLGLNNSLLGHLPKDLAARLAPLLASGKVMLRGDGFAVGRGCHGDPFTLLVHADEGWFKARPPGDKLAAQWTSLRRCLETELPPEGEDDGGCFRFPRD